MPLSGPIEGVCRRGSLTGQLTGRVLRVDEIQSADVDSLRTISYAWQHLQSDGRDVPAAIFSAGLPNSAEVIGSTVTFTERFEYRPLKRLDDDAVRLALVPPLANSV